MVLVGPSGCGKTTTLRMINRLVEPTHGTILLDGKDIKEGNPAHLRRGIGYVIQQTGLFPHRTVEDNIATVPVLNGWPRKQARGRSEEHTSELQSHVNLVCRLLLEKKKISHLPSPHSCLCLHGTPTPDTYTLSLHDALPICSTARTSRRAIPRTCAAASAT